MKNFKPNDIFQKYVIQKQRKYSSYKDGAFVKQVERQYE